MSEIKVLIVDDHAILRMGLSSLLATEKDIAVVGEVGNGEEAHRIALEAKPDVVIMDLMMPGMDGVETTRRIRADLPDTKVLILTTFSTADGIAHALEAGANGAIMKNVEFSEFVSAIRTVMAGGRAMSPEIERIMKDNPPVPLLSRRQSEILEAITRGLSNADIAQMLGISLDMVKEHVQTLFAKIGAANRTEAASMALRKHLIKI